MQWCDTEIVYRYDYTETSSEEKGPIRGSEKPAGSIIDGLSHEDIQRLRNKKREEYTDQLITAFPDLSLLGLSTVSLLEMDKLEIKFIEELDKLHLVDQYTCDSEQYALLEEKLRFLQDALRCCIVQETYVGNFDDIIIEKERAERIPAIADKANHVKRNDARNILRFLFSHFKCLAVRMEDL
jgi:hypothetical protein